jgi:predicted ATP-dependent endonuclease of OLD family
MVGMIRRFRADRLNGRISCDFAFSEDINIITGRNGSGKTTVLKAIWYLMSANIELIPTEMSFDLLELEADDFKVGFQKLTAPSDAASQEVDKLIFYYQVGYDEEIKIELTNEQIQEEDQPVRNANRGIGRLSRSIFFPTFRRIEGGFSMNESDLTRRGRRPSRRDAISTGFADLSERLSFFDHTFVSSISTDDIVRLLTEKYATVSETTNRQHKELSNEIIALTTRYTRSREGTEEQQLHQVQHILEQVNAKVLDFNARVEVELKPFTTLSQLVSQIFADKGIKVAENIVLGDVTNSINSGLLSSGEKQMLSFLCYNALADGKTIFIDEPEISLHADWQRILFPTLIKQETGNQFIIATHSPFIYTKYADKELTLNIDRGDGS